MNIELIRASADFNPVLRGIENVNAKFKVQEQIFKASIATNERARAAHERWARQFLISARSVESMSDSLRRHFSVAQASSRAAIQQAQAVLRQSTAFNSNTQALVANNVANQQAYSAQIGLLSVKQRDLLLTQQQAAAIQSYLGGVNRATAAKRQLNQATREGKTHTESLLLSWQSLVRLLTIQVLHQTVSLMSLHLRNAAREAGELQLKIAEVIAISDGVSLSIEQWGKGLRDVSEKFGMPVIDLAEAVYQTVSNQIAQGEDAIQFVDHASRLATAAVGDTTDAVQALSAVMNAYKLELADTDKVASYLFETIKLGRLRLTNLANDLGQVTPIAAQLGVDFTEVAGALAQMTKLGMSSSEAVTQLRNIFIRFLMPTQEMISMFDDLGVSGAQAFFATRTLAEAFEAMQRHAGGNIDVLTKLNNRIRGLGGTMEFTSRRGLAELKTTTEQIQGATDSYMARSEEILATSKKMWDQEVQSIKNIFLQDVGPKMLVTLVKLSEATGGFHNRMRDLISFLQISAIAVLGALGLKLSIIALKLWPLSLALIALGYAIKKNNDRLVEQQKELDEAASKWSKLAAESRKEIRALEDSLKTSMDTLGTELDNVFNMLNHQIQKSVDESRDALEILSKVFEEQFKGVDEVLEKQLKTLADRIKDTTSAIDTIEQAIQRVHSETDDILFQIRMEMAGDLESKQQELLNRLKVMEDRYQQALLAGDTDRMDEVHRTRVQLLRDIFRMQQTMSAENDRRAQKELDLAGKIAETREKLRIAKPEDKAKFQEQLREQELERKSVEDRLKIHAIDVKKEIHQAAMEHVKNLENAEAARIKEKARLEKEEFEKRLRYERIIELQQRIADSRIMDITARDLARTPEARKAETQLLGVELERFKSSVDELPRLLAEAGVRDPDLQRTLVAQREYTQSLYDARIEQNKNLDQLVGVNQTLGGLQERVNEISGPLAEVISKNEELAKRYEEVTKRLLPIQAQLALMAGDSLLLGLTPKHAQLIEEETQLKNFLQIIKELREQAEPLEAELMKKHQEHKQALDASIQEMTDLKEKIGEVGLDRQFESFGSALGTITRAILDASGRIDRARVRATTGPRADGNASGGLSYGSESFKTPGEFIFNQDSTRRFLNQYLTGNSSTAQASGSNVNIGDINVTMQAHGEINYDARRLGNMIRREIRQGTLVL